MEPLQACNAAFSTKYLKQLQLFFDSESKLNIFCTSSFTPTIPTSRGSEYPFTKNTEIQSHDFPSRQSLSPAVLAGRNMSRGGPKPMSKYRLYVGNISHRSHPRDVEDLFRDYGELVDFDFKDRGQQVNFCFVEFKSSRDAEDAMYELNGHRLLGVPIIVEPARERRGGRGGGGRFGGGGGPPPFGGGGGMGGGGGRDFGRDRGMDRGNDRGMDRGGPRKSITMGDDRGGGRRDDRRDDRGRDDDYQFSAKPANTIL